MELGLNDKVALLNRITLDLYLAKGDKKYGKLSRILAKAFHQRLTPFKGGLIWDKGLGFEKGYKSMDTSHGNRYPSLAVDLYRAGIEFTVNDLKGMGQMAKASSPWPDSILCGQEGKNP